MPEEKTKKAGATFRKMVGVRLTMEDSDRLDALADRIPIASRHAIAREALRIGLTALENDPTRPLIASPGENDSRKSGRRVT